MIRQLQAQALDSSTSIKSTQLTSTSSESTQLTINEICFKIISELSSYVQGLGHGEETTTYSEHNHLEVMATQQRA